MTEHDRESLVAEFLASAEARELRSGLPGTTVELLAE